MAICPTAIEKFQSKSKLSHGLARGIDKVIRIHPLGTMKLCVCHDKPSKSGEPTDRPMNHEHD